MCVKKSANYKSINTSRRRERRGDGKGGRGGGDSGVDWVRGVLADIQDPRLNQLTQSWLDLAIESP